MRYYFLLLLVSFSSVAQNQVQSQFYTFPKATKVNIQNIKTDFFPTISHIQAPQPDGSSNQSFLQQQKLKQIQRFKNSNHKDNLKSVNTINEQPIVYSGFPGNPTTNGSPNDNDMAISNDGWLISVVNSNIFIINTEDPEDEGVSVSLTAFIEPLGSFTYTYDPKVEYDPIYDRFVMTFLNGTTADNTSILVAFSDSNDPTLAWNLYEIPGNPFNAEDLWSDYPMIAFTEDEVFITINQIIEGVSWQLGFSETLIWQIDKFSAFFTGELQTRLWSNITFENKPIRNLIPIQGGYDLNGPDIFFLSNRNFDVTNDTIFVLNLTGLYDDQNTELLINYGISDESYGVPPEARQVGNRFLQTNDARILGGKFENGRIHFAGNSVNSNTGNATVFYGIVNNPYDNPTIDGTIIYNDSLDLGYPNLSFCGQQAEDEQFLMTFNHTSPNHYAGMSAIYINIDGLSNITMLREGLGYIGAIAGGGSSRWGDYSGSQRKYNEPGAVWASGSYGKLVPQQGGASKTWLAKIGSPDTLFTPVGFTELQSNNLTTLSPNPSSNFFNVDFNVNEKTVYNFSIYNSLGQIVKTLTNARVKAGINRFTFNTEPLQNGVYFLVITDNNSGKQILKKKVVVQH